MIDNDTSLHQRQTNQRKNKSHTEHPPPKQKKKTTELRLMTWDKHVKCGRNTYMNNYRV